MNARQNETRVSPSRGGQGHSYAAIGLLFPLSLGYLTVVTLCGHFRLNVPSTYLLYSLRTLKEGAPRLQRT